MPQVYNDLWGQQQDWGKAQSIAVESIKCVGINDFTNIGGIT